jgi:hypothetical protein
LLGGWAPNITYQLQSGQPFSISTANQTNDTGGSQYAIQMGNLFAPGGTPNPTNPTITCPTSVLNKTHWYNPCAFRNPLPASLITPLKTCPDPTVVCEPAIYPYPTYITDKATAKLFLGGVSNSVHGRAEARRNIFDTPVAEKAISNAIRAAEFLGARVILIGLYGDNCAPEAWRRLVEAAVCRPRAGLRGV